MLRVAAGLNDPDDTLVGGRFKSGNRAPSNRWRVGRDALSTIQHRLNDHGRELRERRDE